MSTENNQLKYQKLYESCQETFISNIKASFENNVDIILSDIKNELDKTNDFYERKHLTEFYNICRSHKALLLNNFETALTNQIIMPKSNQQEFGILTQEQEEQILIKSELEEKIKRSLGEEIESLTKRINVLIGNNYNPFTPKTLIEALVDCLDTSIKLPQHKKALLENFSRVLPLNMKQTFKTVNDYLIENDVLPKKQAQPKEEKKKEEAPFIEALPDFNFEFDFHSSSESNSLNSKQEIFSNKEQNSAPNANQDQNQRNQGVPKQQVGMPNLDIPVNIPESFRKEEIQNYHPGLREYKTSNIDSSSKQQEFAQIEKRQKNTKQKIEHFRNISKNVIGDFEENFKTLSNYLDENESIGIEEIKPNQTKFIKKSSFMENVLIQEEIKKFNELYLKEITQKDIEEKSDKVKNVANILLEQKIKQNQTIENQSEEEIEENNKEELILSVLGLMFDKIIKHKEIPTKTKALILKLQSPIVGLLLKDETNTFFTDKKHIIRLFMDTLGSYSILYNEKMIGNFETIINALLTTNDIKFSHMDVAFKSIQKLIKELNQKEKQFLNQISENIADEEVVFEHSERFILEMQKHLDRIKYLPLRKFIENVWVYSYCQKWIKEIKNINGEIIKNLSLEAKVDYNQSVLLFDMIIWTTQLNEYKPETQEKLKGYLPKISFYMDKICFDLKIKEKDKQDFMFLLAQKHIALFKKEFATQISNIKIKNAESYVLKNYQDMSEAKKNKELLEKKVDEEIKQSNVKFEKILKKNAWLNYGETNEKVKLIWISPKGTIFLLSNPKINKVYKLDKTQLWELYKNNKLSKAEIEEGFSATKFIKESLEELKIKLGFGLDSKLFAKS